MPRPTNIYRDRGVADKRDKKGWTFARIARYYGWKSHQAAMKAYYRFKNNDYPHISNLSTGG